MRSPLRSTLPVAGLLLAGLALSGCGSSASTSESRISAAPSASAAANALPTGGSGDVTIASANFPENMILASVYQQALNAAGFKATVKPLTTRPVIVPQVMQGNIDVEPDYIGSLTEYLNKQKSGPDAATTASGDLDKTLMKARELAGSKLAVLEPSPAADQNAFAVTKAFATKNNLTTISDLAKMDGLTLGGTSECQTYPLCLPGLEKTYGLKAKFMQTDLGGPLAVAALKKGSVQVNEYLSSDGTVKTNDFVLLKDDKNLQGVDNVVPVVSAKYADNQVLKDTLNKVSAAMSTEDLIALNASLSIDRKLPEQAAKDFLVAKGFITG